MTLARHEAHDFWRQSRGLTQIFGSRRSLTLAERCLSIRHQDRTSPAAPPRVSPLRGFCQRQEAARNRPSARNLTGAVASTPSTMRQSNGRGMAFLPSPFENLMPAPRYWSGLLAVMRTRDVVARHPPQCRPRGCRLGQRQWAFASDRGAPMPSLGPPTAGPKGRAIKI
jgi:hypothetical protein